jgi:hypothetical protein
MAPKGRRPQPRPPSPFAWVNGKPYLIVNFDLEPRGDLPPLRQLLEGLLKYHREDEIMLLRPLGPAEARLLRESTDAAKVEAWAQLAARLDDRFRPRGGVKRRVRRTP